MWEGPVGLEFIFNKKTAFRKMWNRGVEVMTASDLLPSQQVWEEQHVLFDVRDGCVIHEGDELLVQAVGDTLVAEDRTGIVAVALKPPAAVVAAIRRAHSFTLARVARVSEISRTADLVFRLG
jgi:hypothetical protein